MNSIKYTFFQFFGMRKNNGEACEIRVKNKKGDVLGLYPSMADCSILYYPEKSRHYLCGKLNKKDSILDNDLLFERTGKVKSKSCKRYSVIYRYSGVEEIYNSRKELLEAIDIGQNSLDRQIKYFGNFKNSEFQITPII